MGQTNQMLVPMLSPEGPSEGRPLVVSVRGVQVAITELDGDGVPALTSTEVHFVGTIRGRHCWAVDVDSGAVAAAMTETGAFVDLMRLFGDVDEPTWAAAGRAVQLVEWARCHRFCGRCGAENVESPGERARRCPGCGLL